VEEMTNSILNTSPKATAAATKPPMDIREYQRLLGRTLPRVIRTEAENERYIELLSQLDGRAETLTAAEKELADLLTLLIEDFEEQHYALEPASPTAVLQELMLANNLKQRDLMDVFGTPSIASEVINGKRNLTTDHIRKLSHRFNVSPELFL
jgi:HTH-type transcriptional regulator/antitoxin HigA